MAILSQILQGKKELLDLGRQYFQRLDAVDGIRQMKEEGGRYPGAAYVERQEDHHWHRSSRRGQYQCIS